MKKLLVPSWTESFLKKNYRRLKVHAALPLDNMVPELVWPRPTTSNDKDFLGQLKARKGAIYVFDKGYADYGIYKKWMERDAFCVTRLNKNTTYEVVHEIRADMIS